MEQLVLEVEFVLCLTESFHLIKKPQDQSRGPLKFA